MSDLFPDEVVTERLRLVKESVADGDLGERYASMSTDGMDEGEVAYVPVEPFEHLREAYEFVADREDRMQSGDAGTYVVRPREGEDGAGEPAGEAELFAVWPRRAAFMTFGLRKRFWGRGYSGERAAALIRLAFERLDLEVVFVSHLVANENSQRAIERYVDRFDGRREGTLRNQYPMNGEPRDVVQYSIGRDEYEASGEPPDCEFVDERDDERESR
ncbi:GNAT family protein [Halorubellus sp. PRR65]|uniref:GNAT family N-acetyltransferase n=1 Tax=Halorubellus sp. PRR65 TaxID=3098148 RepID=UPI002B25943F|nr:GNAT family protein [Halorubellus sp. PRR65]